MTRCGLLLTACLLAASPALLGSIRQEAAAPASVFVIESPLDYEVFQRRTADKGEVLVKGRALVRGDRIEAHVENGSPPPSASASAGAWQRLTYDASTGAFSGSLTAPAGGFHELRVRIVKTEQPLAETEISHVGVGEVFVIAGQSNSTNYAEVRQETKSRMVVAFDGHSWRIADDPQPGVQDTSSRGSFIPAFGDALYAKYHVTVGIADVGHGSTSVRQWLPEGERFAVTPTLPRFVREVEPGVWESDGSLFNGMMVRIWRGRPLQRGGSASARKTVG